MQWHGNNTYHDTIIQRQVTYTAHPRSWQYSLISQHKWMEGSVKTTNFRDPRSTSVSDVTTHQSIMRLLTSCRLKGSEMRNARRDKSVDGTLSNSSDSKARSMSCKSQATNMYVRAWK
jgi:hypothetical protein